MRSRSGFAAIAAILLLGACSRPPVEDRVVTPRVDESAPASPRVTADASSSPTPILPAADALDDGVISARIRAQLMVDPALAGTDVSVNTDNGVVNLTGTVASREQAAVVLAHAQAQDGVMRVDDHLAVDLR